MSIGKRIKDRRKELGLSAEDLAARIGKNPATVYRYEKGDIEKLPATIISPLAKALNWSPGDLLVNKDSGGYYADPEVAAYAEELRTNPNMRILFSAAKDISKEDMEKAVEYITFLKSKERPDNDFSE